MLLCREEKRTCNNEWLYGWNHHAIRKLKTGPNNVICKSEIILNQTLGKLPTLTINKSRKHFCLTVPNLTFFGLMTSLRRADEPEHIEVHVHPTLLYPGTSVAEGARNSDTPVTQNAGWNAYVYMHTYIHVHYACTCAHVHVTKHMLFCAREHPVYHGNVAREVPGGGRWPDKGGLSVLACHNTVITFHRRTPMKRIEHLSTITGRYTKSIDPSRFSTVYTAKIDFVPCCGGRLVNDQILQECERIHWLSSIYTVRTSVLEVSRNHIACRCWWSDTKDTGGYKQLQ